MKFIIKFSKWFSVSSCLSSRLTLLLNLSDIPLDLLPRGDIASYPVSLPSRLKMMDSDAFSFFSVSHFSLDWNIFQDFLDSDHPLALDGRRHTTAASACLNIIFIDNPVPHSRRTLRVDQCSHQRRTDFKPNSLWHRSLTHWHAMIYLSRPSRKIQEAFFKFRQRTQDQRVRSGHLKFLLEKSAYSDRLLNFARRRVFRFGYLQRNHPTYMKKAIFALAKYIQRVTGETAEVRTCESIWGRQGWFTAN